MLYLKASIREAHPLSFCLACVVCFPSNAMQAAAHRFVGLVHDRYESQNPRVVWVERHLRDHPVPILPPWAGMPPARSGWSGPHPTWPWTLPGTGIHSFSEQLIPTVSLPNSKNNNHHHLFSSLIGAYLAVSVHWCRIYILCWGGQSGRAGSCPILDFTILEWWKSEPREDFGGYGVSTAHSTADSPLYFSPDTARDRT